MKQKTENKEPTEEIETVKNSDYAIPNYCIEIMKNIKEPADKLDYKIEIARKLFKNQHISKSGSNSFQNFQYFELKDIVPVATEICTHLGLSRHFELRKKKGVMTIKDVETGATTTFYKERPEGKEGGNFNQQTQGIGKISTYLKRYCYLDFLEVVEPDSIDAVDNRKEKPKKNYAPRSLKKQMVLNECKQYIDEHLEDPTDIATAKKLLDELKMSKRINQAVYNKMCSDMEAIQ